MIFNETAVCGVFVLELEKKHDERGYFARSWCRAEFEEHGLDSNLVQCNVSFNHRKGTLRGIHYQVHPHGESKLMRCTRGRLFDVALDLRPGSPTFLKWTGVELSPDNGKLFFIPKGCAHGFQTLEEGTEIFYQMSDLYVPEAARGVRWNDPLFGIRWPDEEHRVMSVRDRDYPDARPGDFSWPLPEPGVS